MTNRPEILSGLVRVLIVCKWYLQMRSLLSLNRDLDNAFFCTALCMLGIFKCFYCCMLTFFIIKSAFSKTSFMNTIGPGLGPKSSRRQKLPLASV